MHENQTTQIAVVDRSLASYTREFYDGLVSALTGNGGSGNIVVAKILSDWLNPWDESDLAPRIGKLVHTPPLVFSWPRGTVWPGTNLWRTLSALDPQLLVVREYSPYSFLALLWGKIHKRKTAISTDVGEDYKMGSRRLDPLQKLMHSFANQLADGIIACTADAERLATKIGRPCILAPHAIDTLLYTPGDLQRSPRGRIRILQVSGFYPWKGIDLILEAFTISLRRNPQLELRIIGGGDPSPYRALIRQLGISDRVSIQGFQGTGQLIEEYRQADIFTLSSRTDTLGVVAHEAAACGLPLIISSRAGASEIFVGPGINGFVEDPEQPELFAARIEELARHGGLRETMGTASRQMALKWCVKKTAQRTADWLSQL